jgi:hypothetical protein
MGAQWGRPVFPSIRQLSQLEQTRLSSRPASHDCAVSSRQAPIESTPRQGSLSASTQRKPPRMRSHPQLVPPLHGSLISMPSHQSALP